MTTAVDLDTRGQIHDLVVHFYREIAFDPLLGPVFGEVAEVDWAVHIPKLIDYRCRVLLGQPGYDGYILGAHQHVHDLDGLTQELFDRWYSLFVASVDARWRGPMAEKAKAHAGRMAGVLAHRIIGLDWTVPEIARPDAVAGAPSHRCRARHGRARLPRSDDAGPAHPTVKALVLMIGAVSVIVGLALLGTPK